MIPAAESARAADSPRAFWGWLDVAVIVCLAIPCLIIGSLVGRALPLIKPLRELIAQFVFYAIWMGLFRLLFRFKYGARLRTAMAWKRTRGLWLCVPAGAALAMSAAAIGYLLRAPQIDPPFKELWDRLDTFALFVIAGVILGPAIEETIFRGFLMPLAAKHVGGVNSVFAVAVPFALLHGAQYHWSWQYLILVGVSGLAFGWARLKFDSTLAAALLHGSYNGTFLVAQTLYKLS